jgi:hypothetical protein
MAEKDITERFGTEFLTRPPVDDDSQWVGGDEEAPMSSRKGGASREAQQGERSGFDVNLQAYAARRVLVAIRDLERKKPDEAPGVRLPQVSEQTGMGAEVLLPVTRWLEDLDLLETLEVTEFGDNVVSLTSEAEKLLSSPSNRDLLLRLGLK